MFVDQLDELFVANVVGNELDVFRGGIRSVVLVLEESKSGPFGMFFPKLKDGFGSLQGAPAGEMKNGILAAGDVRVIEIAGSEAGEMT